MGSNEIHYWTLFNWKGNYYDTPRRYLISYCNCHDVRFTLMRILCKFLLTLNGEVGVVLEDDEDK
jgi:hypothetical protein